MPIDDVTTWSDWRELTTNTVQQHQKEIYVGDGKDDPPLMVRVDRLERSAEKTASNTTWILRLLGGAIVTGVVDILTHHYR